MAMTEIILRARLIGGEHLDVTYDEAGSAPGEIVEEVISTLAEDNGVLRCRPAAWHETAASLISARSTSYRDPGGR
jgi:hypothetical protein